MWEALDASIKVLTGSLTKLLSQRMVEGKNRGRTVHHKSSVNGDYLRRSYRPADVGTNHLNALVGIISSPSPNNRPLQYMRQHLSHESNPPMYSITVVISP